MPTPLQQVDEGVPIEGSEILTTGITNEDVFANILSLYARPGMVIADVTYGRGVFWKKTNRELYDFKPSDILDGVDFRDLPYADSSIDMLVLDPPYRYTPKASRPQQHLDERYQLTASVEDIKHAKDVVALYYLGMKEAYRVLRRGGFLVVKCQDTTEAGVQYRASIEIWKHALDLDFADKDRFIVTPASVGRTRWKIQKSARKAESYFWVFRKSGAYPFGYQSAQPR